MRSVPLSLVCVLRNTRYEGTRSILHYRAPAFPLDLYRPRSMAICRGNRCNFGAHWHSGCWHGSIHWVEASSQTRGHTPSSDFLFGIYASDERFQSRRTLFGVDPYISCCLPSIVRIVGITHQISTMEIKSQMWIFYFTLSYISIHHSSYAPLFPAYPQIHIFTYHRLPPFSQILDLHFHTSPQLTSLIIMPPAKVKPSDVAAEAKKTYIPYIESKFSEVWPAHSYLIKDSSPMQCEPPEERLRCRMTVIEGDPVDVALELGITIGKPEGVALVNMANDKRPGGDWEAGVLAPEESICRRSNLVATLKRPAPNNNPNPANYPISSTGGIYSPYVVIFRSGPDRYQLWQKFKTLPVISVPPVKRPKLDQSGTQYSFDQERELMKDKIRTVLRMAVWWGHSDLALGSFGCGPQFRNPTREVATMWRDLLYFDDEFRGHFSNVVFAFDPLDGSNPNPPPEKCSSSKEKSSSKKSSSDPKGKGKGKASFHLEDMEIFRDVFDPAKMFPR